MPIPNSNSASVEEKPAESKESEDSRLSAWPGIAPLGIAESDRFFGHERELERLVRLFKRPESGQTPVVWLTGDAGAGKTSLVMAGLLPRLREEFGESFDWHRVRVARGAGARKIIAKIVEAILRRTALTDDAGGLGIEGRLRQFDLLMDQDAGEAVDYLAACYRKNVDLGADESGGQTCLIIVDQLDRMDPSSDLLPSDDPHWLKENLEPLVSFLRGLSFAGCFPCLVAVRSLNFPAIPAAATEAGFENLGTEVQIAPLEFEAVRSFFESAPSFSDSGRVVIGPELLDSLVSDAGDAIDRGALPFVSETLKRLSDLDPAAEEIGIPDARWAGGIRHVFSGIAEKVVNRSPDGEASLFSLMAALHPPAIYLDGGREELKRRPIAARYLNLVRIPELSRLTDDLVDARILTLKGISPEQAQIEWSLPEGILRWERACQWLEENDSLLTRAIQFDRAREDWEGERRTPVKLLHSTRAIADAERLLDYHQRRPILSDELREFLQESSRFDEHLGAAWRRRRWIRIALIGVGILMGIALVILLVASLSF